jgi:uncharacterized protein
MHFDEAMNYARSRLEGELPSTLFYHGPFHTRDDVVPAATRLAEMEGIEGQSLTLLLTAAWFHDLGFVERPVLHELIGVRIAEEVLPGFKYSRKQVEAVKWAILATALPQEPRSQIDEILADADLDVLGRADFWDRNRALRRELELLGKTYTDVQWYSGQLKFMRGHTYFTESAHALRDSQKAINTEEMAKALEQSEAVS